MAPEVWNISTHEAGAKDPNQVRNKDLPSLLQKESGKSRPCLDFYMGEWINRPLHPTIGNDSRSYPPVHTCGAAGSGGYRTRSTAAESGKWVASKRSKVSPRVAYALRYELPRIPA